MSEDKKPVAKSKPSAAAQKLEVDPITAANKKVAEAQKQLEAAKMEALEKEKELVEKMQTNASIKELLVASQKLATYEERAYKR